MSCGSGSCVGVEYCLAAAQILGAERDAARRRTARVEAISDEDGSSRLGTRKAGKHVGTFFEARGEALASHLVNRIYL